MGSINRSEVIEFVFQGLERTESIFDYTQSLRGAPFPADSNVYCDSLEIVADGIREECDMIIRGIGGITVNHLLESNHLMLITVVGVTKYEDGNWHFPYRSGHRIAAKPLEMPTNWLRNAYASLSSK